MKFTYGVIAVLTLLCGVLALQVRGLYRQQGELTIKLDSAIAQITQEIERGERIEQATVRLEKAENDRWKALREYERDLSELHENDTESGVALDVVVPDAALRGLRTGPIAGPSCDPRDSSSR